MDLEFQADETAMNSVDTAMEYQVGFDSAINSLEVNNNNMEARL